MSERQTSQRQMSTYCQRKSTASQKGRRRRKHNVDKKRESRPITPLGKWRRIVTTVHRILWKRGIPVEIRVMIMEWVHVIPIMENTRQMEEMCKFTVRKWDYNGMEETEWEEDLTRPMERQSTPSKNVLEFIPCRKHGEIKRFTKSDKLKSVVPWVHGKKHGIKYIYDIYQGGVRRKIPYDNGVKHGVESRYSVGSTNPNTIPWVHGKKHGVERTYYCTGDKLSETPWSNGIRHGVEQQWFLSGGLAAKTPWNHGCRNGTVVEFLSSGVTLHKTEYVNDIKHGVEIRRSVCSGDLLYSGRWKNGQKHGTTEKWYAKDQPKSRVEYVTGQKVGEYKKWDKRGKLIRPREERQSANTS